MIDQLLKKFNLKYEELNTLERETLLARVTALQSNQITIDKIHDYVSLMKSKIEEELSNEPEYIGVFIFKFRNDKNILLKARLRNYMLIENFITSDQRVKKQIEDELNTLSLQKSNT